MRVAAAAVWHETLGFAHTRTELEDFERFQLTEGQAVIERNSGVRNEMGGFLGAAAQLGIEVTPLLFAGALPSPTISARAWAHITVRFLERLEAAMPLDGLFVALHGATAVEGRDDPEADLLNAARRLIDNKIPLVATLDLHGNVSRKTFDAASALIAYDTYPHVDIADRGAEAAHVLKELADGEKIAGAFRKLPLLTAPQVQCTSEEPMKTVMARVFEWERDSRVVSVSVCPGYPYSDVPRLGATVLAYTRGNQSLAETIAADVARFLWSQRHLFQSPVIPVGKAVSAARTSSEYPVVLVDSADNIGGGAPGDGTVILQELLDQKAEDAVVTLADCEAVKVCFESRPGDFVKLQAGGRYDRNHGQPVQIEGRLRLLSDGVYHHAGSYMTGLRVEMGRTAVIVSGGVEIVLMECKAMPFDAQQLRSQGIEPSRKRIIAVKSAVAWKAAYGDMAKVVIAVDTPGLCSGDLSQFSYDKRPRPMFPFEDTEYDA